MSGRIIIGTDGVTRTPAQHAAWVAEREAAAMPTAPDALTRMAPPTVPTPFRYDDEPLAKVSEKTVAASLVDTIRGRVEAALWARFSGADRVSISLRRDGSGFRAFATVFADRRAIAEVWGDGLTEQDAYLRIARVVGVHQAAKDA